LFRNQKNVIQVKIVETEIKTNENSKLLKSRRESLYTRD